MSFIIPHIWKGISGNVTVNDDEDFIEYMNRLKDITKQLTYEFFIDSAYKAEFNKYDIKLNNISLLFYEPLKIYNTLNYFCDTNVYIYI